MKALILGNINEKNLVEVSRGEQVFDEITHKVVTVIDVISKYEVRVDNLVNKGIRNGWEVSEVNKTKKEEA